MQQISSKSNFYIILKSDNIENYSEHWQKQCQQLYNSIFMGLPKGSIEPLNHESNEGERVDLVVLFSTLIVSGITGIKFATIILDALKTWLEFRPTVEVDIKCPDGSTVKITKLPLKKLSKFFEENPQLSICEGLKSFENSNK